MANKFRGEADLTIDGKTYPVAMTLDTLGRLATVFGVETIDEVETRLLQFKIADFPAILRAFLEGNGHAPPLDRDLMKINMRAYIGTFKEIWNARPGDPQEGSDGDPQKRGR